MTHIPDDVACLLMVAEQTLSVLTDLRQKPPDSEMIGAIISVTSIIAWQIEALTRAICAVGFDHKNYSIADNLDAINSNIKCLIKE